MTFEPRETDHERRLGKDRPSSPPPLGAAAAAAAAAQLGMLSSANAQSAKPTTLPLVKPGTHVSFAPLKRINAGLLNVAYAEAGPADGPPVILLHGWSYDIHSFVDVTPLLTSAGYRVLVPYLRGYGATRFLSSETFRKRSAFGVGGRRYRLHGCAQDRQRRSSPVSTGVRGRRTSLRRSGRSASRRSSPSADT